MYTPPHYKNENIDEVREFIKANSFGILVSQTKGRLWGTHIPMELDSDEHGNTFYTAIFPKPIHNGKVLQMAKKYWQSSTDHTVIFLRHGTRKRMCQPGITLQYMFTEKSRLLKARN